MDDFVTEINISRVIHADKLKVMRLVTKVGDFPSYIPSVKEAEVLSKDRNIMRTKWKIQVENVPVQWIEEDGLDLRKGIIRFRAVEGDLNEFSGEWVFSEHSEGTQVSITVRVKVEIPAIRDFASAYVEKIVRRNFEAILGALERRLISLRYLKYRNHEEDSIAGFGIIGHLYNFYHLEKCFKMLQPEFEMPSKEFIGSLFNLTPPFKLYDIPEFRSKAGAVTKGSFMVATFIPDMIDKDIWTVFSKVVKACRIAEKNGVGVVALGGFTSIVGERIGHAVSDEVDVAVTTGNTFTVAMVIDGVFKAVELLGRDISSLKAAVIGGTGDIGSACVRVLAEKALQVTITGRTKANLTKLKKELSGKSRAKILTSLDNEAAVKDADVVIAATSAVSSILNTDWFKPGSIICDVGYPKNISYAPVTRDDILVFSGGLSRLPVPINLPIDLGLPSPDVIYGCFAEAMILALEKRYENFSFGRGNIYPDKIEKIRQLGRKHGFVVSDFYWGGKLISEAGIEKVKEVKR